MKLLDWFRRRGGDAEGARPSAPAQPVDGRFRADPSRFDRAPAGDPAGPLAGGVLPREDAAVRTLTSTHVTVNGREVDPSDPEAAPLLAMLRDIGAMAGARQDPETVQRVFRALSESGLLPSSPGEGDGPGGVAERLAELEKLRAAGLVSEAEYQAKRRQILDAL